MWNKDITHFLLLHLSTGMDEDVHHREIKGNSTYIGRLVVFICMHQNATIQENSYTLRIGFEGQRPSGTCHRTSTPFKRSMERKSWWFGNEKHQRMELEGIEQLPSTRLASTSRSLWLTFEIGKGNFREADLSYFHLTQDKALLLVKAALASCLNPRRLPHPAVQPQRAMRPVPVPIIRPAATQLWLSSSRVSTFVLRKQPDPVEASTFALLDLNLSTFPFLDLDQQLGFSRLKVYQSQPASSYTLFECSSKDKAFMIGNFSVPISPDPIRFQLRWNEPDCGDCEAQGKGCRLKSYSTKDQTECFYIPKLHISARERLMITGIVLGSLVLAMVVTAVGWRYYTENLQKEGELKNEKFLEDYRAFKPSRYSYTDIKRITDHFKDKLVQGGYGTVFKGRLSTDILVAVKVLNDFKGNGEEFINEVSSMGRIHHVNMTRLVGFCADGYNRALVYEYLPNESLEKFIFAAKCEDRSLSWERLDDIALGVAKGIEYLHQGCEQRILHFDIKPHNILLDHKFNPKISDFGLAKLCSKEQSAISMTTARGTMGYIAPEAYKCLDKGEELRIRIEDEQTGVAKKLSIVGLWCIQWYPVDRPSIKEVVQMLEGDLDVLTMPPDPFASTDPMKMGSSISRKSVN
ncbi:putative RING/U-box superfamily protein [Hibiscus syriacus]|uniref:non-specific serine/threonine protein kinase n=1 Tax=Hibiscus syriacus TaxID=106335 RepID=A0A6A2YYB7_HIBSY|nr:putative RING/U-box superfamily protein [Hibiscus syriacus]